MSQDTKARGPAKSHRGKTRLIGVTSTFDLGGTKTYKALQKQMPTSPRRTLSSSVNRVTQAIAATPLPQGRRSPAQDRAIRRAMQLLVEATTTEQKRAAEHQLARALKASGNKKQQVRRIRQQLEQALEALQNEEPTSSDTKKSIHLPTITGTNIRF